MFQTPADSVHGDMECSVDVAKAMKMQCKGCKEDDRNMMLMLVHSNSVRNLVRALSQATPPSDPVRLLVSIMLCTGC